MALSANRAGGADAPEPLAASQPKALIPSADTFQLLGVNCDNCRFGYHWSEVRHSREWQTRGRWPFRTLELVKTPYQASGIECFRYPVPTETPDDYWCGEYASVIEAAAAGETAKTGSTEGESAMPKADAHLGTAGKGEAQG